MYYRLAIFLAVVVGPHPVCSQRHDSFVASIDGGEAATRNIAKNYRISHIDQVEQVLPQQRKLRVIKNHAFNSLSHSETFSQDNETFTRNGERSYYWNQKMKFNDPYLPKQWYLANKWLNVFAAWSKGFTGKGITAAILDDGIQYDNEDLQSNYEPGVSYDVSNLKRKDDDPSPDTSDANRHSHGTYCAAILSASANNKYCGVGVAYESKIGGVRLLNGKDSMLTDLQEALALSVGSIFQADIVVSSWGPTDDGKTIDKPGPMAEKMLKDGVLKGRQGKGTIFVWAVGNGGAKDNCNLDGYVSSIYTISINAVTKSGLSCLYDEPCSASMASVYVGGKHQKHDHVPHNENMVVPQLDGECISTFQGTSAAAPLAAGIIALMLQANNDLTWRDVQHIIVRSGRRPGGLHGWKINGAGHPYHHYFGFGTMDALKAVKLASKWESVPQHTNFTYSVPHSPGDYIAVAHPPAFGRGAYWIPGLEFCVSSLLG
ncbi:neuroendocrine convertase 2-like isoform X2 [Ischnura elegans]|uniref:neuroendocrine convertase 2-like isoform X2 n=1 Tax=Ischnura elegans TaxID=197161 RepID=UPI001ED8B277|nr:neuroendocrine convertase 2-like isoform X2 [Ischnura elegans]